MSISDTDFFFNIDLNINLIGINNMSNKYYEYKRRKLSSFAKRLKATQADELESEYRTNYSTKKKKTSEDHITPVNFTNNIEQTLPTVNEHPPTRRTSNSENKPDLCETQILTDSHNVSTENQSYTCINWKYLNDYITSCLSM